MITAILKNENERKECTSFIINGVTFSAEEVEKILRKEIPIKPISIYKKRMGVYTDSPIEITGSCPNCHTKQSFGSLSWHENFNKFCYKCGQRLDWSDADV